MARDLRKCFEIDDEDDTTKSVMHRSIGFVASFLLKEIAEHSVVAMHRISEDDSTSNGGVILEYLSHSAVFYKVASLIQIECISMTQRGEDGLDDHDGGDGDYEAMERMENELILMEIITRDLVTEKGKESESRSATDSESKKEGFLKMLDSIGIALRFVESQITADSDCDRSHSLQQFLSLNLKILINISNGRSVTLKQDTLHSLFFALGHFHSIEKGTESQSEHQCHHQLVRLIVGVLINCCERNRSFRAQFNEHRVGGVAVIRFVIRSLMALRAGILRMETDEGGVEKESEDPLCGQYIEWKVMSFYMSLLLGFLLQNTLHFKQIAKEMDADLSPIQQSLNEYLLFQRTMERSKHSNRTLTVIAKIQQIVKLRMQSLKQSQSKTARNSVKGRNE